jgi:aryl-alcohol dehydrogenase-like predicted oxidoreductase
MLERNVLAEDLPAASRLGLGFLAYGPLARGLLTGRYRGAEPEFPEGDVRRRDKRFHGEGWQKSLRLVNGLEEIGRKYDRTPGQVAINWVLCQPGVTAALVGARHPDQVKANLGGQGWRLEDTDLATIATLLQENG